MRHQLFSLKSLALLAFIVLAPSSGLAQSGYTYSIGLLGGLGGSADAEPDTGLDNLGWQARFSMELEVRTLFSVRAGQLQLAVDDVPGGLFDSDLSYVTLSGEYTFPAGFYESGVFIGLGAYDLSGDGVLADESAIGLTVGTSGDFRITKRLSCLIELAGHYADLDYAQLFFMAHAGLSFHF